MFLEFSVIALPVALSGIATAFLARSSGRDVANGFLFAVVCPIAFFALAFLAVGSGLYMMGLMNYGQFIFLALCIVGPARYAYLCYARRKRLVTGKA
jgi:hypothetical protein